MATTWLLRQETMICFSSVLKSGGLLEKNKNFVKLCTLRVSKAIETLSLIRIKDKDFYRPVFLFSLSQKHWLMWFNKIRTYVNM